MNTSHEMPSGPPGPNGYPMPPAGERNWAMWTHLSALSGFIGVPFGGIIGPLVLWLIKKDEMAFVDDQGKEALNFQISVTIATIILGVLSMIPLIFCVTIPMLIALVITAIVFVIIAAVQSNGGRPYRYPMTIRFIN